LLPEPRSPSFEAAKSAVTLIFESNWLTGTEFQARSDGFEPGVEVAQGSTRRNIVDRDVLRSGGQNHHRSSFMAKGLSKDGRPAPCRRIAGGE